MLLFKSISLTLYLTLIIISQKKYPTHIPKIPYSKPTPLRKPVTTKHILSLLTFAKTNLKKIHVRHHSKMLIPLKNSLTLLKNFPLNSTLSNIKEFRNRSR